MFLDFCKRNSSILWELTQVLLEELQVAEACWRFLGSLFINHFLHFLSWVCVDCVSSFFLFCFGFRLFVVVLIVAVGVAVFAGAFFLNMLFFKRWLVEILPDRPHWAKNFYLKMAFWFFASMGSRALGLASRARWKSKDLGNAMKKATLMGKKSSKRTAFEHTFTPAAGIRRTFFFLHLKHFCFSFSLRLLPVVFFLLVPWSFRQFFFFEGGRSREISFMISGLGIPSLFVSGAGVSSACQFVSICDICIVGRRFPGLAEPWAPFVLWLFGVCFLDDFIRSSFQTNRRALYRVPEKIP